MNEKDGKLIAGFLAKYANLENARNLLFEIIQMAESSDCAPNLDRLNIAAEQTPGVVADIIHAYIAISPWLMPNRILLAYDCCRNNTDRTWYIDKENAIAFGVPLGIFDALAAIDVATHRYNIAEEDTTEHEIKIFDEIVSHFSVLITRLVTNPNDLIGSPSRAEYYGEQFDSHRQRAGTQFHAEKFFKEFDERFEKNVRKAMEQIIKLDTDDSVRSLDALSPHLIAPSTKQPFLVDMILRNIGYALLKEMDGLAIAMAGRQALRQKRESA